MKSYQWGGGGRKAGEKVQGIRSIIGRYRIDRGECGSQIMYMHDHGHGLRGGLLEGRWVPGGEGHGEKIRTTVIA